MQWAINIIKRIMGNTKTKKNLLSRTAIVDLMKNSKGHFITIEFITNEGELRTMNCKVKKDVVMTNLGYLNVRETKGNAIKSVNTRTLQSIKIDGQVFHAKV